MTPGQPSGPDGGEIRTETSANSAVDSSIAPPRRVAVSSSTCSYGSPPAMAVPDRREAAAQPHRDPAIAVNER